MGLAGGATPMRDSYAYPPRGLSREEAARYVGIGATFFVTRLGKDRDAAETQAEALRCRFCMDRFAISGS